jgi:hypothetical protein
MSKYYFLQRKVHLPFLAQLSDLEHLFIAFSLYHDRKKLKFSVPARLAGNNKKRQDIAVI